MCEPNQQPDGSSTRLASVPAHLIVGIGGGGCNLVSRVRTLACGRADLLFANTDASALAPFTGEGALLLGPGVCHGKRCDANRDRGRRAAEESRAQIATILGAYRAVTLVAGLGGGCGSGALPVFGAVARTFDLTVAILVTTPFSFESTARSQVAEATLAELTRAGHEPIVCRNRVEDLSASHTMADVLRMPANALLDRIATFAPAG